jgi:hypothetical protein
VDRENALDMLPKEFSDPGFDPVLRLIRDMPIPSSVRVEDVLSRGGKRTDSFSDSDPDIAEKREMAMGQWLFQEQARSDMALDAVQGRLSKAVMQNYEQFVEGMQLIQNVDSSIARALSLASSASRRLASAKSEMVSKALLLVQARRRRERLSRLRRLLEQVSRLVHVEQHLGMLCDRQGYVSAVRSASAAREAVRKAPVREVLALAGARERIGSGAALLSVRMRVDTALRSAFVDCPRDMDAQSSGMWMTCSAARGSSAVSTPAMNDSVKALLELCEGSSPTRLRQGAWTILRLCRVVAAASRAYLLLDQAGIKPDMVRKDAVAANGGSETTPAKAGRPRVASALEFDHEFAEDAASAEADDAVKRIQAAALTGGGASHTTAATTLVGSIPDIVRDAVGVALDRLTKDAVMDVLLTQHRRRAIAAIVRARQIASCKRLSGVKSLAERLGVQEGTEGGESTEGLPTPVREFLAEREHLSETLTFAELCKRLSGPATLAAVQRCSAAVTAVMHAHACVVQWAKDPMGPWLNNEGLSDEELLKFLFSNGDPPKASSRKAAAAVDRSGLSILADADKAGLHETLDAADEKHLDSKIRSLRPAMLRSRGDVWQAVQQRIGELLLECASGEASTRGGEVFLAPILAVCRDLAKVGTEYAGASAGSVGWSILRDAAAVASSRTAERVHHGSAVSLKEMLSKDAWQLMPVQRSAIRGLLNSVRTRPKESLAAKMRSMQHCASFGGGTGTHVLLPLAASGEVGWTTGKRKDTVCLLRGLSSPAVGRLLTRKKITKNSAMALSSGAAVTTIGASSEEAEGETSATASAGSLGVTPADLDMLGFLQGRSGRVFSSWRPRVWQPLSDSEDREVTSVAFYCLPNLSTSNGNPFGAFSDCTLHDEVGALEATAAAVRAAKAAYAATLEAQTAKSRNTQGRTKPLTKTAAAALVKLHRESARRAAQRAADEVFASAVKTGALNTEEEVSVLWVRAEALVNEDGAMDDVWAEGRSTRSASSLLEGALRPLVGSATSGKANLEADTSVSMAQSVVDLGRLVEYDGSAAAAAAAAAAAEGGEEDEDTEEEGGGGEEEEEEDGFDGLRKAEQSDSDADSDDEIRVGSAAAAEREKEKERERREREALEVRRRMALPVVTPSVIKGVVGAAGRYASAMESVPGAGVDALRGLFRLFDTYLFAVATTFLPRTALRAVCASPEAVAAAAAIASLDPRAAAIAAEQAAAESMSGPTSSGHEGGAEADRLRGLLTRGGMKKKDAPPVVLLPDAEVAVEVAFRAAVVAARVAEETIEARRLARKRVLSSTKSATPGKMLNRAPSSSQMGAAAAATVGGASTGTPKHAAETLGAVAYGAQGCLSHFLATHTRLDHRPGAQGLATVEAMGLAAQRPREASHKHHPFLTLRAELRRIAAELQGPGWVSTADVTHGQDGAVPAPILEINEDVVDMKSPPQAPGLSPRWVAAESLGFCLQVLHAMAPRVAAALPPTHRPELRALLVRSCTAVAQLRGALASAAAGGLGLGLRALSDRMAKAKWDVAGMAGEKESEHVAEAGAVLRRAGEVLSTLVSAGFMPELSRVAVWSVMQCRVWGAAVDGFAGVSRKGFEALGPVKKDAHDLQQRLRRHGPTGLGDLVDPLTMDALPQISPRDQSFLLDWVNAMVPDGDEEVLRWATEHRQLYTRRQLRALVEGGFNSESRGRSATRALVDRLSAVLDEAEARDETPPAASSEPATPTFTLSSSSG